MKKLTLDSAVSDLVRLKENIKLGLNKLKINTIRDLLYHFPTRYADASVFTSISGLKEGETVTIRGTVKSSSTKKTWGKKVPISEMVIEDVSGSIKVIWFNQAYISKMISKGNIVELTGKVSLYKDKPALVNPTIREEKTLPIDNQDSLFANQEKGGILTPIYPETKGLSSLWFNHAIMRALSLIEEIPEHIPKEVLEKYSLPNIKSALVWIHSPKSKNDATIARKRFAFDEIFAINTARQQEKNRIKNIKAYNIDISTIDLQYFINRFNFELTKAQKQSVDSILKDLEKDVPMSRLLEGDVGSGKTAVAAIAAYATVMNRPNNEKGSKQTFGNLQVAYMAPTEILATQHFESFIELFAGTGISIALITGSGCRKYPSKVASNTKGWTNISRSQLSKWIASGEIPIVIGTHALIQKSLKFKHLALTIIDEQHRFGLKQREALAKKDTHFPHLLSMTATPIPRTLALTIYGDLDLSLLDTMPVGRKPVKTILTHPEKRDAMYEEIKIMLNDGRQLYVICPRIDEPDPQKQKSLQLKSVKAEAERLKKYIFPEFEIGVLHSKMKKDEKEEVMQDFKNHKIDILVSTSVVEVGVNVPNATMIIIEGAERFGLAQLHQLRGRVTRSNHQAYCYILADAKSEKTEERMKYFLQAKDGFALAEYDLVMRGSGELTGSGQWGVTDIGMEALRNLKLVEAARNSAEELIQKDPELKQNPNLSKIISKYEVLHFE